MASTPVVTSPADYAQPGLPFDVVGTSDGVLVEVRDDAGLLVPATQNPAPVTAGAFSVHVTGLQGNKGAAYVNASGQVVDAPTVIHITNPTSGASYPAGTVVTVRVTCPPTAGSGFRQFAVCQMTAGAITLADGIYEPPAGLTELALDITLIAGVDHLRVSIGGVYADNDNIPITVT